MILYKGHGSHYIHAIQNTTHRPLVSLLIMLDLSHEMIGLEKKKKSKLFLHRMQHQIAAIAAL